jgi:cell division septum initiation protein DivIVA
MSVFDGYDDFDPLAPVSDEDFSFDADLETVGRHARRDIEQDLRDVIDIVANAKQMPLSASALIPRDEVLALLEQAVRNLPDEIREARWALRDREALMEAEQMKAVQLMDQVRAEAARMVDKTEIVRQSHLRADQIIAEAQARARAIINQSEDFIDGKLAGFEIVLERLLRTTRSGRERLKSQSLPTEVLDTPAEDPEIHEIAPAPEESYGEPEGEFFFDQDA